MRATAACVSPRADPAMEHDHVEPDLVRSLGAYVRGRMPTSADADDLVQTVLLRLVESREEPVRASVHAWLRTVARHAIADFYRRRSREVGDVNEEELDEEELSGTERDGTELDDAVHVPDGASAGALGDDAPEITRCLAPLLARLDPDDRTILERVDLNGESQAEIARELDVSLSTVKSRTQRARSRLEAALVARCEFERDGRGMPVGPARCRPAAQPGDCGCAS